MPKALILNVDDNAAARYARNRILKNAGYEVRDAASGRETLERLSERPQLVVLDVGLPDIDGFQVCRAIKSNPETSWIAVLQVSASFVKGTDRTRALEGGADSFIIEPVEPEVLVATVNSLLRMRKAEEELHRSALEWRATFDAVDEGVALLDDQGCVRRCNRAFSQLLAVSAADIENQDWSELTRRLFGDAAGEPVASAGPEARRLFRLGDRWLQVGGRPVPDTNGASGGRVIVLTDVTEMRKALTAAEQANRLKDDFLATLSHELRTPLNAIVGWTQLLQGGTLDAKGTIKAVQIISRNAQIQNQLIADILDVSRIIAGKLRLRMEYVDVATIVEAALDTVRPAAVAKNIRLESALDPTQPVYGDAGRLQQVVWNLLSNAIKFAPKGGCVRTRVREEDGHVSVTVEDDGPGIDPQFLPYVFDRFRQADSSTTRPKGGLGLGLAIVRHLVELHGGSVHAGNREEGGAALTVTLPRSRPHATAEPVAEPHEAAWVDSAPSLRGLRVLIVEDEEDGRDLAQTILQQCGADVLTAASAAEALPILQRERPDVLVSDVEMPGEDGYALIRKVRALRPDQGGATPAAALTAYARYEDGLRALEAGFQLHVPKPVKPVELVTVIAGLARRS